MKLLILLIVAYLIGSIPNGVWIGKKFFNIDIRQHGSGNIGTTNTLRVLGPKAGMIVLILDMSKGIVATLLPVIFHTTIMNDLRPTELLFGLAAIIGHTFSIFDHFKGGKAVATSAGMLLAYNPTLFLIALAIFIITIYLSSMVSLASLMTFTGATIGSFFYHDIYLSTLAIILTIFVFYRHRQNIIRIKNGNENLIHFGIKYKHHHA